MKIIKKRTLNLLFYYTFRKDLLAMFYCFYLFCIILYLIFIPFPINKLSNNINLLLAFLCNLSLLIPVYITYKLYTIANYEPISRKNHRTKFTLNTLILYAYLLSIKCRFNMIKYIDVRKVYLWNIFRLSYMTLTIKKNNDYIDVIILIPNNFAEIMLIRFNKIKTPKK